MIVAHAEKADGFYPSLDRYEVSDPKHSEYGQHKTHAEIAAILAVPESRMARVVSFWKFLNLQVR